VGYAGAWYWHGAIEGNFRLAAVAGHRGHRHLLAGRAVAFPAERRKPLRCWIDARRASASKNWNANGITAKEDDSHWRKRARPVAPTLVAGLDRRLVSRSLPAVFVLRSFLFEPFKIPSGLHDSDLVWWAT
jgi:signal peptidase I